MNKYLNKNKPSYWNQDLYSLSNIQEDYHTSVFEDLKIDYLIESINSDIINNRFSILLEDGSGGGTTTPPAPKSTTDNTEGADKGFFAWLDPTKKWLSTNVGDPAKKWVQGDVEEFKRQSQLVEQHKGTYNRDLKTLEDAYNSTTDQTLRQKYGEYLDWVRKGKVDPGRLVANGKILDNKTAGEFFEDGDISKPKQGMISPFREAQDKQAKAAGLSGQVQLMGQWMQSNPGYTAAGLGAAGLLGAYYLYRKWKNKRKISKEDAENADRLQRRFQQ